MAVAAGFQTSSAWTIPLQPLERLGQVPAINTAETALEFVDQSGGGGAFDLHDDVTTALTAISGTDRFVLSDESASGDPNRYITHSQLLNAIRDIFTSNNAAPAATDRFYVSDESASGDPIEYLTFAQLEAAIQPDASEVDVDTANFSQNLTSSDDTVQAALETIDSFSPIPRDMAAGILARGSNRHAQRHRVHLASQQQHGDPHPGIDAMGRAD